MTLKDLKKCKTHDDLCSAFVGLDNEELLVLHRASQKDRYLAEQSMFKSRMVYNAIESELDERVDEMNRIDRAAKKLAKQVN